MTAWYPSPGLFLFGAVMVALVGLLLVCWGLWGDRSKGRPRCPKCWYDMRGTVRRLGCPAGTQRADQKAWCRAFLFRTIVLIERGSSCLMGYPGGGGYSGEPMLTDSQCSVAR